MTARLELPASEQRWGGGPCTWTWVCRGRTRGEDRLSKTARGYVGYDMASTSKQFRIQVKQLQVLKQISWFSWSGLITAAKPAVRVSNWNGGKRGMSSTRLRSYILLGPRSKCQLRNSMMFVIRFKSWGHQGYWCGVQLFSIQLFLSSSLAIWSGGFNLL